MLLAVAGLHLAATVLFLTPSNPVRSAAQPELDGYMRPFFAQNWRLFAPNPLTNNEHLLVRAQVTDSATGETITTEWFNITEFETAHLRHNPTPSRLSKTSTNVYRRLSSARNSLSSEQRTVLDGDYSDGGWDRMRQELRDAGASEGNIGALVRVEQAASAYTTAVARGLWGSDVLAVQIKLLRQPAVPFDQRLDGFVPPAVETTPGWRPLWRFPHHDQAAFDRIFGGAVS